MKIAPVHPSRRGNNESGPRGALISMRHLGWLMGYETAT